MLFRFRLLWKESSTYLNPTKQYILMLFVLLLAVVPQYGSIYCLQYSVHSPCQEQQEERCLVCLPSPDLPTWSATEDLSLSAELLVWTSSVTRAAIGGIWRWSKEACRFNIKEIFTLRRPTLCECWPACDGSWGSWWCRPRCSPPWSWCRRSRSQSVVSPSWGAACQTPEQIQSW